MNPTETSLTVSTGGGINVNTPYTYMVTSIPGGRQSGPGNFNIINNRECTQTVIMLYLSDVRKTTYTIN